MGIAIPQRSESTLDKVVKSLELANQGVSLLGGGYSLYNNIKQAGRADDAYAQAKQQDALEKDPNSPLSQQARQAFAKVTGSPLADTVSAAQLKSTYGPLSDYAMQSFKFGKENQNKLAEIGAKGAEDRKTEVVKLANQQNKPTPDQYKVSLYGKRMEQSEDVFNKLAQSGYDPTGPQAAIQRSGLFPEAFKTEQQKMQAQAERNFVNAVLRRESGSAISPNEFASAEAQYFPRVGDTPEVLAQKAQNRALAINGFKAEAGSAWNTYDAGSPRMVAAAKPGSKDLMPSAMANEAGSPSFTMRDIQMYQKAKEALKANPNDPQAQQVLNIARSKGLK